MPQDKIVVGHRGLPDLYPENTLLSIQKAIQAGAQAVEFDVQLSQDKVPIVYHDDTLDRVSDKSGFIVEKPWLVLQTLKAHYPSRFAEAFIETSITALHEMVATLKAFPTVLACVEIKEESVNHFGVDVVVDAVLAEVQPILNQVLFLSFSKAVIENLHSKQYQRTCWVLRHYDIESQVQAQLLKPEVLAVNQNKLPTIGKMLWNKEEGIDADWMVYHTETPETVDHLFANGAKYVETDNIEHIAQHRAKYFK